MEQLKAKTVHLYAQPDFIAGIFFSTNMLYYTYYLTDIAFISAATMGLILTLARIIDAIQLPVIGGIIQRSNFKWGQYRSWLIIALPFLCTSGILMFTRIGASDTGKSIFYGLGYIVFYASYTAIYSAHTALINKMSTNPKDGIRLSAKKAQYFAASQIGFGLIFLPIVGILGQGDEGKGYFYFQVIFAAFTAISYYIAYRITAPFDSGKQDIKVEDIPIDKVPISKMVKQLFTNKPLTILIFTDFCRWIGLYLFLGMIAYYFKYILKDMNYLTIFFTLINVAALTGSFLAEKIAARIGKKRTYMLGVSILGTGFLSTWIFADSPLIFIAIMVVAYAGHSMPDAMLPALYSDVSIYIERKTGDNIAAFIMTMYQLPIKIGAAAGAALTGFGLAKIGYNAQSETMTQGVLTGISNLSLLIPAAFIILAVILISFYTFTEDKVVKAQKELEANKKVSVNN